MEETKAPHGRPPHAAGGGRPPLYVRPPTPPPGSTPPPADNIMDSRPPPPPLPALTLGPSVESEEIRRIQRLESKIEERIGLSRSVSIDKLHEHQDEVRRRSFGHALGSASMTVPEARRVKSAGSL